MNITTYLQWFADNRLLVNSFFGGFLEFSLLFSSEEWRAGYTYVEDYDGTYFFDDLQGQSTDVLKALDNSYNRTLPLVTRLSDIRQRFDNPDKFIENEEYIAVNVSREGKLFVIPMIHQRPSDERISFRDKRSGLTYLYSLHHCGHIFPDTLMDWWKGLPK